MESSTKDNHRFYEFLPKIVDVIDNYIRECGIVSEKREQQIKDLQNFATQIRALCEKRCFVNFDPFIKLDIKRHEAVLRNDKKFLKSYFYSRKIRQMFFSNQEIRNANLIANFQSATLSEKSLSSYQKKVDKILEKQSQNLSRSPPLNCLVDSSLRPIYSTYFHLYEPKHFPTTHKAINSYYLSSLLPLIIRMNPASSIAAYESELVSTKDMLEYLLEYSVRSRTDYELFELSRKHPVSKVIMNSSPYLQKKEELDNAVKIFLDMMKNYERQFSNLKNVFYHRLEKMEEQNEQLKSSHKKLNTLHKRVETVRSEYRILQYLNVVFKNQQAPKQSSGVVQPLVSLFQKLVEWSKIQDSIQDVLNSDSPTDQDLDKCISSLNVYYTNLHNVHGHLCEKEKKKECELSNCIAQYRERNATFDRELYKKFEDSNKVMEELRSESFNENIKRLKEKSEAGNEFGWNVCSTFRLIDRKPLQNLMEPIINLTDPSRIFENDNSEIKRRMQEIEDLKVLLKKREEEIESDTKVIEEFSAERKESEKTRKAKSIANPAIDEKYTEVRLFLTCKKCDSPSEYLAKPCMCKICKKCYEKSKKKKTHCPACDRVVEKYIKLNW